MSFNPISPNQASQFILSNQVGGGANSAPTKNGTLSSPNGSRSVNPIQPNSSSTLKTIGKIAGLILLTRLFIGAAPLTIALVSVAAATTAANLATARVSIPLALGVLKIKQKEIEEQNQSLQPTDIKEASTPVLPFRRPPTPPIGLPTASPWKIQHSFVPQKKPHLGSHLEAPPIATPIPAPVAVEKKS